MVVDGGGGAVVVGGGGGEVVVGGAGGAVVVVEVGGEAVVDFTNGTEDCDSAVGVYVAKYAIALNGVAKLDGKSERTYGSEGVGGSSGGVFSGAGSGGTWVSNVPSVRLIVGNKTPSGSYCEPA